jgi:hypothetical protein
MSLEEATVSNMWDIAAIVEVLERLGWIIEMGQWVAKGDDALSRRRHPVGRVCDL